MKTTEEIKSLMLERKTFLETKVSRLEEELDETSTELAELTLLIETGKIDWEPEEVEPEDNLGHWVHKTSGVRILVIREDENDVVSYRSDAGSFAFPLSKETLLRDWEPEGAKPQEWNKPEKGSIWESGEVYYEIVESGEFVVKLMPLNGDGVSCFIRYQEFYESFKPVAWPLPGDTWKAIDDLDTEYKIDEVKRNIVFFSKGGLLYSSHIANFLNDFRLVA